MVEREDVIVFSKDAYVAPGEHVVITGRFGIALYASVPADNATHYYDLQFRREVFGLSSMNGFDASMTIGSNADDYSVAETYIESGDLA